MKLTICSLKKFKNLYLKIDVSALPEGFVWINHVEKYILKNVKFEINYFYDNILIRSERINIYGEWRVMYDEINNLNKSVGDIRKNSRVKQSFIIPLWPSTANDFDSKFSDVFSYVFKIKIVREENIGKLVVGNDIGGLKVNCSDIVVSLL